MTRFASAHARRRPARTIPGRTIVIALATAILAVGAGCGSSDDDGGGTSTSADIGTPIRTARTLPPFEPGDEIGEKPDLPKVLAFLQDSPLGFQQEYGAALKAGAEDAGLRYQVANSNGDAQREVSNMQQFLVSGVGAMIVGPVNPEAQTPVLREAVERGVAAVVGGFGPATIELNAPQYQGGRALADLAARYITTELGGNANVVILNQESIEPLRPRFQAIHDVLKKIPGAKIVADVEPSLTDPDSAFKVMSTVLQKNPDIDVVLGADAVVLGAKAALEAAHKDKPTQFLAGIDCEEQALSNIEKGGPYKGCVGYVPAIFGYALGRLSGDWLAGRSVPQQMCVLPVPVSGPEGVAAYRRDQAEARAVYEDPARLSRYVSLYGSISYETRGNYLDFPWSPTAC
jgi:ribose transport system substrate-binding protein